MEGVNHRGYVGGQDVLRDTGGEGLLGDTGEGARIPMEMPEGGQDVRGDTGGGVGCM